MSHLTNAASATNSRWPCWILEIDSFTILLDCAISEFGASAPVQNVIPHLDAKTIQRINVVLISNHETFLALPYISEFGGFNGIRKIFATDPTVAFGKLRLEEFIRSNPQVLNADGVMQPCYSNNEAQSCIEKINRVSSGYCLGSTNWMISFHFQKILYISTSSTTLGKHSAPIDIEAMKFADYVICNNAAATKSAQSTQSTLQKSGKTIFSQLSRSIENGGTVVFLCKPFGCLFDLLELIEGIFLSMGMTATVHVISTVANESLKVCNILGEWMNNERKERVFKSNVPLMHGPMMDSKRLLTHMSMHTVFVHKPQVLVLDYSDIENSSFSAFLKWRKGGACTYIVTESDSADFLMTFLSQSKINSNTLYCPFDAHASEQDYVTLLQTIKPGFGIVVPHASSYFMDIYGGNLSVLPGSGGKNSRCEIPIDSIIRSVLISKSMAQNVVLSQIAKAYCGVVSGTIKIGHPNILTKRDYNATKIILGEKGFLNRLLEASVSEVY
ncbi:Integrator complex subunit 9 [Physocladia obscura]|uniref:Integrator complex subunit 9 n=1 Tax=Physocladia obscura TaxID=109957 RepID=A0AAD5T6P4_9FUNG|nr:Integrator complex subunit 9 [Physocladia obscura]